jgi:GT2 family glycosyltransferase
MLKEAILDSHSQCNDLSVLIPALNEGRYLQMTVDSVRATVAENAEIIVVDDGSTDGCADFLRCADPPAQLLEPSRPGARLGAAAARNKAAAHAHGERLIFLDAHVQLPEGWSEPLLQMLDNPAVGAVSPAISVWGQAANCGYGLRWTDAGMGVTWLPPQGETAYAVPLLPGACFAIRRNVFAAAGGFDRGLVQWGSEDTELSLRLWLLGYELAMVPGVTVAHLFRPRHPYSVAATAVVHNMLRVAAVHFTEERFERVDRALRRHAQYAAASELLTQQDAAGQRLFMQAYARRDDQSYFVRFGDIH